MAENRTNRENNTREKAARAVYTPPSALPDPTPEPGYSFRWVATHVAGKADPSNVSKKMREFWEPVKAADHPELRLFGDASGNVEIGGLMLCKQPIEQTQARNEYYNNQSQSQMDAVDNNFMRNSNPRMPLYKEHNSSSSRGLGFGSGTK